MENRPMGRKKNVSGESKGVNRRDTAVNTGKLGNSRPSGSGNHSNENNQGGMKRSAGGSGGLVKILGLILVLLLGGGGGFSLLNGGDSTASSQSSQNQQGYSQTQTVFSNPFMGNTSSTGWNLQANTGKLNTVVAEGSREKRTVIKGNGEDQVTIMVYMCGTDLESKNGMATSDLVEMTKARIDEEHVNILVYTGGCSKWNNNVVSNNVNQIYQVKNGGLVCLEKNMGTTSMTAAETLTQFIKWCNNNYPANRNELIMWDHGGGSVSGYGYDEKNARTGSMNLTKIDQALKNSGVKFDFIGFDACLMATLETGLLLDNYADYMVASEETEPGIGWYYTNWLTKLSQNPSMPTIEIGKIIADDFVNECAKNCRGQKTTLSVVDLAELKATVPDSFKNFAASMGNQIEQDNYKSVSDARYNSREFAQATKIDQIDLVDFANRVDSEEGKKLINALLGAVKYNMTSSNMTNAYGLSIYFPYRKLNNVDTAVNTYKQIGMDDEYSDCIMKFASLETTGQVQNAPSSGNMMGSLLGSLITQSITGGDSSNSINLSDFAFIAQQLLDSRSMESYIEENSFNASALMWTEQDGKHILSLPEEQWALVHDLALNVFYDDGTGYIDLGLDNVFEFTEDGDLIGDTDGTWLAVNGQPVAYYYENTVQDGEDYTITGHIPALLNEQLVNLIVVFDSENPDGYIAGARADYAENETETVAKAMTEILPGDTIDFLCDYYSYDGEYQASYPLGDTMVAEETMTISNVDVSEGALSVMYRFTDIYNNEFWTEALIEE